MFRVIVALIEAFHFDVNVNSGNDTSKDEAELNENENLVESLPQITDQDRIRANVVVVSNAKNRVRSKVISALLPKLKDCAVGKVASAFSAALLHFLNFGLQTWFPKFTINFIISTFISVIFRI